MPFELVIERSELVAAVASPAGRSEHLSLRCTVKLLVDVLLRRSRSLQVLDRLVAHPELEADSEPVSKQLAVLTLVHECLPRFFVVRVVRFFLEQSYAFSASLLLLVRVSLPRMSSAVFSSVSGVSTASEVSPCEGS